MKLLRQTCKANRQIHWQHSTATEDTLRAHTTVGFPALQFNTVTEQFVATRKMPERVMHNLPNLSQSTLQQTNMLLFAKLGIPCESTSNFFWRRQQNDDFRVGKNNSGDEFLTVLLAVNTEAVNRRAKAIARQDQAQFQSDYQGEQSLPDATKRTLYELRVHQIELEMQNEEVRRAHTELDIQRARYFDIYDNAPVGYCIVNDRELIVEANRTAATLLGVVRSELIQRPSFASYSTMTGMYFTKCIDYSGSAVKRKFANCRCFSISGRVHGSIWWLRQHTMMMGMP